jgi:porin
VGPPFKYDSLAAALLPAEIFTLFFIYVRAKPFGQAGIAEEFLIRGSVSCKYVPIREMTPHMIASTTTHKQDHPKILFGDTYHMAMKFNDSLLLSFLLLLSLTSHGFAGESGIPVPVTAPDYAGGLASRSALTGDLNGLRTSMTENGLCVFADVTTVYQNILEGGIREKDEAGGSADLDIRMDVEKMGWWKGGFIRLFAESRFGNFINSYTGAMAAVNADGLFPLADENETTLSSAAYYHYLSDNFCLFTGKLETLDRDFNAVAGGRGKTQFMNQNLVFNPVTIRTVPYSALGGGLFLLIAEDQDVISLTVLDPNGEPNTTGFNDAFDGGATFMMEFKTNFSAAEAASHQLLGFTYGTKDYPQIDNIFGEPERTKDAWCVYYNYDQLFWDEKDYPGQKFGYFLRLGYGDEDTNPIEWFYSFGLCAQGVLESRRNDTCGIGYFYSAASDRFPWYMYDDEQGCELYYNIEAAPWLHITPDLQMVIPSAVNSDTSIIGGVRVKIDL